MKRSPFDPFILHAYNRKSAGAADVVMSACF